ncbi:MAG: hypothetical protein H7330_09225 [Hymenobacteraceae bacterium]|nr:hypothetical protein [Hymenobacteraceae bacterium]
MPPPRYLSFVLAALVARAFPAAAQTPDDLATYATRKQLTVSVLKLPEAKVATNLFIRRRAVRVQKQEETPEQLTAEFSLPTRYLPALDSLANALGYVLENNLNAQNTDQRLQELRDQETDNKAVVGRLQAQLRGLQEAPKADSSLVRAQREQISTYATALRRTRQQIGTYATHDSLAFVTLRVFDEITFPTANRKINFVNMPGVEAAVLRIEAPRAGLASQYYRGYALKYLFTRGKSYFNLGFYQSSANNTVDSTFINELFVINFGQDFYPRNFGRGKRKFLNLYTTYQIGGFILNRNGDKGNDFIPNANVGLGIELLKTKHILLDTKGSYFLPLHSLNRNLRGVLGQASFSFVF